MLASGGAQQAATSLANKGVTVNGQRLAVEEHILPVDRKRRDHDFAGNGASHRRPGTKRTARRGDHVVYGQRDDESPGWIQARRFGQIRRNHGPAMSIDLRLVGRIAVRMVPDKGLAILP